MSNFFIQRPVFAWVLAIITMMLGIFSLLKMPLEQYPNIAPPSVSIRTNIPGSSAQVLENSVTQIIEQALIGIDNMRYFSSESDSDGNVAITVTFNTGTNPDVAQMQVQNKLQNILSLLPQSVQQQGLTVTKSNSTFILSISVYSNNPRISDIQISDLLFNIQDQIARVNGVGMVRQFGSQNAMRIWLDPGKMFIYKITVKDVINAIKAQNVDLSAGQVGGAPAIEHQGINTSIVVREKLRTQSEFENIIVGTNANGSVIKLSDVARVDLGFRSYSEIAKFNGNDAGGLAVGLASGANSLKTSIAVKKKIEKLKKTLPADVFIAYPYDSTPFVEHSIKNVVKTLIEGIILVFVIMFLFLQNFRATLIPTIAIPVVILGTSSVLYALGFSLNTFTMFAMVIAIGLLVDDAIVVVENVERIMQTEGLNSKEATIKSMSQIQSALVGVGVVLSAVFVPMAFFGGSAGAIYKQFTATIVISMVFSVLVALILSPCLCVSFLKTHSQNNHSSKNYFKIFTKFNLWIDSLTNIYIFISKFIAKRPIRFFVVYLFFIAKLNPN